MHFLLQTRVQLTFIP